MDWSLRWVIVGAAAVLAVGAGGGLLASTVVASRAYQTRFEKSAKKDQTISVTGSARKRISSDLGVWRIRVSGRGKDLPAAYGELASATARIQAFLKEKRFNEIEIAQGAIDTSTHYTRDSHGNATTQVAQYTLTRGVTVTSRNLNALTEAASSVTELIRDGVQVESYAPEYHYTQLSDLKVFMIGEASKDARSRADQIAVNAGCRVTGVRTARMGVLQITRPYSTDVSDSGYHDTSSIEKDVTSVVTLTLGVEDLGAE
jgi:hypothetical protein